MALTRFDLDWGPIVVGGVGGSGTRVLAAILRELGFYLGPDTNGELDNLWFTLLFKRDRWFDAEAMGIGPECDRACRVLGRALTGATPDGDDLRFAARVASECSTAAMAAEHTGGSAAGGARYRTADWAALRLESLRAAHELAPARALGWGWKEPNSHVFLPWLTPAFHDMRFVLVLRHGLDMAFSTNQQQLLNWGARYGVDAPRDPAELPGQSLMYWLRANRQAIEWGRTHLQERFLVMRYEDLCRSPAQSIGRLCEFLGHRPPTETLRRARGLPRHGTGIGRYRDQPTSIFRAEDIAGVRQLGYEV